jgi:hypothetical protein
LHFENEGIFLNYSTVNGHAPTETTDDVEKDGFFDFLEKAYDISPRNDIKIALGDFSAQVGKEAVKFPTTDKYSLTQSHGRQWIPADVVCSIAEHNHGINILPS